MLYLAAVVRPGMRVLDGLMGVGARATRWLREVPGDYEITANDRNPQSVAVARRNLGQQGNSGGCRGGVRVLQRPLGALLAEERFDLIELDAPGTPVSFLDAACQAVRAGPAGDRCGHLLVTATDAMVLAGAQPGVCRRRYGARALSGAMRAELAHEVAVRILVGAIARTAARYGLAAPVVSYWRGHLYGAFVRLARDDRGAESALDALGYAVACPSCWDRRVVPGERSPATCRVCGRAARLAGPLWTGCLCDPDPLHRLLRSAEERPLGAGREVRAALAGWVAEAAPPLFYDLHAAAAHCGAAVPPLEAVRQRLLAAGHLAVRTHFAGAGIKTDAGARRVLDLLRTVEHHTG